MAVISHPALDELAARGLARRGVRAVLNAEDCLSPSYPNGGPSLLLAAGIPVVDRLGPSVLAVRVGEMLEIRWDDSGSPGEGEREAEVWRGGLPLVRGRLLTPRVVEEARRRAEERLEDTLTAFFANSLQHAARESLFFARPLSLPEGLGVSLVGRQAVVVARAPGFEEDLRALRPYLREVKPAILAVDGAADGLLRLGFRPDLIVGDMDSAGDAALRSGATLVVHAYPDGRCPGLERLRRLGLSAYVVPAPGTSEDLAFLLADTLGAEVVVAVGAHSGFYDFLEKGRSGMGSSLLVRLRLSHRLVDARGVSLLYGARPGAADLWRLLAAALLPLAAAAALAPAARGLLSLWWLQLRLTMGL